MYTAVGTPKGTCRLLLGLAGKALGDGDLGSDEEPLGDSFVYRTPGHNWDAAAPKSQASISQK